jgi:predicted Kef-type K+ transport protein
VAQFSIVIAVAYVLGVAARFIGLPPLVGFLVAGFVLKAAGYSSTPELETVADLGVTLLLFSIGLKLRVGSLLRPAVWAGASLHMLLTVALFGALLCVIGFGIIGELDLATAGLIAFALSFSSTVFAVKVFDEQGQSAALHARTAIGILIMQDLVAVVFLAASKGQIPSPWALALVGLIPARRVLKWLMERCGHGELLLLLGVLMTFGGFGLFEVVRLKGDLGALIFGMLVADQPKAKELARSLLGFKDLFLVGFFLSIGLRGLPSLPDLGIALFLVMLVPIKVGLFFALLTRFRLRARTATMSALGLANYSEFGLIVGAVGVSSGWLSDQWLLIIAVAVAMTFIAASPANSAAHRIYDRFRTGLSRFETATRLPEEEPVHLGDAEVVVFGMGRIGTGAYDALHREHRQRVVGLDADHRVVGHHAEAGRHVIRGDPTDLDFWDRLVDEGTSIKLALLALPNHQANLAAAAEMAQVEGRDRVVVAATATYEDEVQELLDGGVDVAFDLYSEAGQGFADFVCEAFAGRGGS